MGWMQRGVKVIFILEIKKNAIERVGTIVGKKDWNLEMDGTITVREDKTGKVFKDVIVIG